MVKFNYEEQLRNLDFAKYHFDAVMALLKYKNDNMLNMNMSRFKGDIDLVIDTLEGLRENLK